MTPTAGWWLEAAIHCPGKPGSSSDKGKLREVQQNPLKQEAEVFVSAKAHKWPAENGAPLSLSLEMLEKALRANKTRLF